MAMNTGYDWEWPGGHRHAVSLTFGGTTEEQRKFALPFLAARGLLATFYVDAESFLDSLPEWQSALSLGHELGNGCLLNSALPSGDLPNWNFVMIDDEIAATEAMLDETLGAGLERSFCYPHGVPSCRDGNYSSVVAKHFRSGASGEREINSPLNCDLSYAGWTEPRDVTDLLSSDGGPLWLVARIEEPDHAILDEAISEWQDLAWIVSFMDAVRFIRSIRKTTVGF